MSQVQQSFKPNGSSAAPYTGTWGRKQIIHLLRRTLFGASPEDIQFFEKYTLNDALEVILNPSDVLPNTYPLKNYDSGTYAEDVKAGETWVNSVNYDGALNGARRASWKDWHFGLMMNQDRSIQEKMTLFWQNHFGTETDVVDNAIRIYMHNLRIRQHALGNFKTMVREITVDPAMLVYLNGRLNQKSSPDENYARELQELFCIGKGKDSKFTEDDVKAASKILTGYQITTNNRAYLFNPTRHDTTDKQFSAFYGNKIIKGKTNADGEKELDELLEMIFGVQEVAKFLVRRLYTFFIYYEITADVETNFITPLADIFRNNKYEIKPLLKAFFSSQHFYDAQNIGCIIKSPMDLAVGLFRQFKLAQPPTTDYTNQYLTWRILRTQTDIFQQSLGDPPNVAGYPAYYQEPSFHEIWINSSTLPARRSFQDRMLGTGYTYGGTKIAINGVEFARKLKNPEDPNTLIKESIEILLGLDLSQESMDTLKKDILLSGQSSDYYWTEAWNTYLAAPTNTNALMTVTNRLKSFYTYLLGLAEFQLS